MSQGNIIQGQASGKLGDTVLMVRNGTQVARVYTTSGARSGEAASFAARLQRVRFGSASNEWQLYRFICTRMFRKGRNTNQSDYNYFVKRNVDNLPYFTKLENADGVCCMMPGQFSEGNLGRIELLSSYVGGTGENRVRLMAADQLNPMGVFVGWGDKLSKLKDRLKLVYTNARKVTYLLVSTSETTIQESSETFVSQFFQHNPVVIDLYQESVAGENEQTIQEYFAARVADIKIKECIEAESQVICGAQTSFSLYSSDAAHDSVIENLGILIFASNDLVSDCYTTIVPATSVSTTRGVYSVWGGYRTEDALQVACDSYGFQSGVMRDQMASVDTVVDTQAQAYNAKLLSHFTEDRDLIEQEIKASALRTRKVVRNPTEETE